ncbi:MAG: bifunctional 5,10-methylenetetrahydrofolate dehydrogenase/5,10-methenyltetrahydrofolate cyclohydrolase [Bacteriovoracaceae bacterium]|nr:bifunctional 5,10-methylenetetrahydrofolate dehydrogenase/5,10-methenyltetrahydrofolate cyclohydrolase [Bacteriovoracaceae bacterium]
MQKLLKAQPILDQEIPRIQKKIQELVLRGVHPLLKIIVVGDRIENALYAKKKIALCEQLGAKAELVSLPEEISTDAFEKKMDELNHDSKVHGIIIQLPVPNHLPTNKIFSIVDPIKDVDGFHPLNINKLYFKDYNYETALLPCTAVATIDLLKFYQVPLAGKNIALIGRSFIVTKPLLLMLNDLDATVTWCHSKSSRIPWICQNADIIISATGKSEFIDHSYISTHHQTTLVDIGIAKNHEGKIRGDLNLPSLEKLENISYTPVPGGIGPLTVLNVVKNLVKCATKTLPN